MPGLIYVMFFFAFNATRVKKSFLQRQIFLLYLVLTIMTEHVVGVQSG